MPTRARQRDTGEPCSASDNDQEGSDECSGDPNGGQPVRIVGTKDEDEVSVTPGLFLAQSAAPDGSLALTIEIDSRVNIVLN